jgi:hypothetical protein
MQKVETIYIGSHKELFKFILCICKGFPWQNFQFSISGMLQKCKKPFIPPKKGKEKEPYILIGFINLKALFTSEKELHCTLLGVLGPVSTKLSNPRRASMGFLTIYKGLKPIIVVCIGMASSIVSMSSKCHHVSQQDSDIVIICMDPHDTSPPPHSMILNASTLSHLISSITHSSSTHFTPFLLH